MTGKYRAEIDGLRALAVVPVILFHAGFETFSGGFVGVDVFFVISGYLITNIIYQEMGEGRFSIVRFYERRVRRILPALLLVSGCCLPFAWLWMMPSDFKDFSQSLVAVNFFSSNFFFWTRSGYFDAGGEMRPLLHTWSLAVEEQFYVIFPPLLLLLRKFRRGKLLLMIGSLTLASFLLSEWASHAFARANFYLLPSRAWELGAGSLLAIALRDSGDLRASRSLSDCMAGIGLALILFGILTFDRTTPFPGGWALFPVVGTVLIIAFASGETIVGRLLGWRPCVGLGLISYSAYLWHQPLFAFARIRSATEVSDGTFIALSLLSVGFAFISWRYIEQPFRNRGLISRGQIFMGTAAASCALVAFGLVGHFTAGLPQRLDPDALRMARWADARDEKAIRCQAAPGKMTVPASACVYGDPKAPIVALWGDSHATALVGALANELNAEKYALKQLTYGGCRPAVGYRRSDSLYDCNGYNTTVLNYLIGEPEIGTVIVVGRWVYGLEGVPFDNGEGGVETGDALYLLPEKKGPEFINDPTRVDEVGALIAQTITQLLDADKRVILLYPIPEVGWDVPRYLFRELQDGHARMEPLSTSFEAFRERSRRTIEQLDKVPDHPNLIRVSPSDVFCNTYVKGRCVAQLDGVPLYFDDDHLNIEGAALVSRKIVEALKSNGQ